MNRTIDDTDTSILQMLQENARVAQVEIARAVGLAPSAVLERVRKLEARGVLRGYTALIAPDAVGSTLLAFVTARTDDRPGEVQAGRALAAIPEVLEVHHVAGNDCLLLKIRACDTSHLSRILRERLGTVPGIRSTRTTIVLETVKESPRLPLEAPAAGDRDATA